MSPFIDCGLYFQPDMASKSSRELKRIPDLLQTGSQDKSVGRTAAAQLTVVTVSQRVHCLHFNSSSFRKK